MDLRDWHSRLKEHFSNLRARRSDEVGEQQPIFALEHGLDEQEIGAMAADIRAQILKGPASWEHHLPWVVYATELGYRYSGDEYWQTFEQQTPGWLEHGDRYWVRRCFLDFQQQYAGAEPTGPWARHFSIICWPITHAILPQDLQRQLAKILFELRHAFTSDYLTAPKRLGELVASRSWGTSSRFQQLAQEPMLIGQIAAALLMQGGRRATSLILQSTLLRIGQDLDRERRARTWMHSARESAQRNNVRFQHGFGSGVDPLIKGQDEVDKVHQQTKLGIEPRLVLRPGDDGQWDVLLEVPNFSHLLSRFPSLQDPLINSRCRIAGSAGRPLARGRLMYGPQRILLRQWPPGDHPLLEFERSSPELDYLLSTECMIRPASAWLFKIASDGLAYELRVPCVRPGNNYILLSRNTLSATGPSFAKPVVLRCEGVNGLLLELPDAITPEIRDVLLTLCVQIAGTIEIWPAGLVPARWDGDGNAAWLSTETPCVALRADHHVDGFVAELGEQFIEIEPPKVGEPVFIELPWIGVGQHTLHVSAKEAKNESAPARAVLEILVREPHAWVPGSSSQSVLLVIVDPNTPTLEQLWDGDVDVEVHGPRGRKVQCTIAFFRKGDTLPHFQRTLPTLNIPVSLRSWRAYIEQHVKEDQNTQNAYDLSHSCEVHLRAGELGAFTLTAEREFAPLRWAVYRTRRTFHLKVIDDTGEQGSTDVRLFKFNTPDVGHSLDVTPFYKGTGFEAQGGLYVVQAGGQRRAVVIPLRLHTLEDLRIDSELKKRNRTPSNVIGLIGLWEMWASARLTGNLFSQTMHKQVLDSLLQEVFRLIGGDRWAVAERRLDTRGGANALQAAKCAVSSCREEAWLGSVILRDARKLCEVTAKEKALWLAGLARRFLRQPNRKVGKNCCEKVKRKGKPMVIRMRPEGPDEPVWLSNFSLRLASCPAGLAEWAGEDLEGAIKRLMEIPTLARCARLMYLAIRHECEIENGPAYPYCNGWEWH